MYEDLSMAIKDFELILNSISNEYHFNLEDFYGSNIHFIYAQTKLVQVVVNGEMVYNYELENGIDYDELYDRIEQVLEERRKKNERL